MKKLVPLAVLAALLLVLAPASFANPTPVAHAANLEFVPLIHVAPDDPTQSEAGPYACTTPAPSVHYLTFHCYTPSDILAAYGVDTLHSAGTTGAGQTIVIVDSYGSPTALSDLQTFSTAFGLPQPNLTIVYPTGKPTYNNSVNGSQVGWAFETSLDLQWAHTIAPDAKLVLVAANPAETEGVQGFPSIFIGEQYAIQNYPGSVISQSFAVTEQSFQPAANPVVAQFDKVYQQAVTNHVTVLGSSGDSGTANIDKQGRVYPYPTVNWPSSDPLVTSAGGTWLMYGWTWNPSSPTDMAYTNTPGSRTEAVWNEPFIEAATGGGRSVLFSAPTFQSSVASVVNGHRGLPDVSWNAAVDGGVLVYTSFPGTRVGWHIVGGTSAASPQLAGLIALTNQLRHASSKQSIGYLNNALYNLPAADFVDITTQTFGSVTLDNNQQYGTTIAGMPTLTGYDLTTGRGSPKAASFVNDLAALP
jgi:subtilase family serine protease